MNNNTENEGYTHGEKCNRNKCDGIIIHEREGGCSCHINPPCSYCTDDSAYCPKCEWSNRDTSVNYITTTPFLFEKPIEVFDDGKVYEVRRYFDSMYEATIAKNLKLGEARIERDKQNSKPRCYVNYSIHEQQA